MSPRKTWLAAVRCASCGKTYEIETRRLTLTDRPCCPCGGTWVITNRYARASDGPLFRKPRGRP